MMTEPTAPVTASASLPFPAPQSVPRAGALESLGRLPAARDTQIVVLCPSTARITGGIKYLFRLVETLRRAGCDAVISERNRARPAWFTSDAPVLGYEVIGRDSRRILVVPEDIPTPFLADQRLAERKVMYCQSHFYAAKTVPDSGSYADFGVTHALCGGRSVYDYFRHRHPSIAPHLIPYAVDTTLFHARPKRECIAYIPRKRPVEAIYLRDLFRYDYPEFRDVEWLALEKKSQAEIAAALGESSVFLSLNRLDSFGLTPVEAMATGCVVAGFTGIGGREYATDDNGFWADEDDFPACLRQLAEAVRLSRDTSARRVAYSDACMHTIASFTAARYEEALVHAWTEILTHHA